MDFTFNNTCVLTTHDDKNKTNNLSGSGFTKQQRSVLVDDHLQTSKSTKTDYFDQPNKSMSVRSDSLLSLSPADANNMLSFSSSSSSSSAITSNQNSLFSFYQPYIRNNNTGYGYGGLQADMHMPASRYKGPFTPSQWMELEHQALIYKHFVANVPVPSNLLTPLRKSLNTFIFPGSLSSTSYASNSYGWGGFHLGFSGNTDPEPGRCRRTDGKKWRCSRDAVPDQKYCERHINRGRHRSRKPVESQNGQAVSGPAATKVGPVVSSSSAPVSTPLATATAAALHRHNHTQTPINRTQEPQAFGINSFSMPKQSNPVEEASVYPTNYDSFLNHGSSNPNPLPNFVDQWSKDEPLKPDWTQLSMSIPMAASDFSSSSNSPAQEKLAAPPPGLTAEFDLDPTQKQASNWIPISWGSSNSMGGPLGEALNRTSSNSGVKCKDPSSGSEMTEMWDAVGYRMGSGSSPTGVLQKTTFVSLSNSSSGSSPKKDEHGGGDHRLLSTLASITSL
ncbi:putative transcription factor interactor and regulator C3H-WRC/GRF family [Helianthus annuus]|nr:putative transcription factor interactor and regulator C3H-WRC/GRF family [Helianthus annuus]